MSLETEFDRDDPKCPRCNTVVSWERVAFGTPVSDRHDPFGFMEVVCPECKALLCITPVRFVIEVLDEADLDREGGNDSQTQDDTERKG